MGLLLAAGVGGCGDTAGPGGKADGPALEVELALDGQPLDEARVVLVESSDGRARWSRTYEVAPRAVARIVDTEPGTYEVSLLDRDGRKKARRLRPMGAGTEAITERVRFDGVRSERVRLVLPGTGSLGGTVAAPPGVNVTGPYFTLLRAEAPGTWISLATTPRPRLRRQSGTRWEFEFDDLPTGSYIVFVGPSGVKAGVSEVEVRPGERATCEIVLEAGSGNLVVSAAQEVLDGTGPISIQASLWSDGRGFDVEHGSLSRDRPVASFHGLAPGEYIILFPGADVASLVKVAPMGTTEFVYSPPSTIHASTGANVRLRLRKGNLPLAKAICGLLPAHDAAAGPRPGTWLRYARPRSAEGVAEFARVPHGEWMVWVFDGIGGAIYDLEENPTRKVVSVGRDEVELTIDVGREN